MKNKKQKTKKNGFFSNLGTKFIVLAFVFQCIFPSSAIAEKVVDDFSETAKTTEQDFEVATEDEVNITEETVNTEENSAENQEILENEEVEEVGTQQELEKLEPEETKENELEIEIKDAVVAPEEIKEEVKEESNQEENLNNQEDQFLKENTANQQKASLLDSIFPEEEDEPKEEFSEFGDEEENDKNKENSNNVDEETVSTPEIEALANVQPDLKKNSKEERKEAMEDKIVEKLIEREFTEKDLLISAKENGIESIKNENPEKAPELIEELKEEGVIATIIDNNGIERELNSELKIKEEKNHFNTKNTAYETEIPLEASDLMVIAEDEELAGKLIDSKEKKVIQQDFTPETREEIRYLMRDVNKSNAIQDGNKVLYQDIWEESDLLVTTLNQGIKEDIILKNSNAPLEFDYVIETVGLELVVKGDGGLSFVDRKGQEKFYTPPPNITDVNGFKSSNSIRYELGWGQQRPQTSEENTEETQEEVVPAEIETPTEENPVEQVEQETQEEQVEQEEVISGEEEFFAPEPKDPETSQASEENTEETQEEVVPAETETPTEETLVEQVEQETQEEQVEQEEVISGEEEFFAPEPKDPETSQTSEENTEETQEEVVPAEIETPTEENPVEQVEQEATPESEQVEQEATPESEQVEQEAQEEDIAEEIVSFGDFFVPEKRKAHFASYSEGIVRMKKQIFDPENYEKIIKKTYESVQEEVRNFSLIRNEHLFASSEQDADLFDFLVAEAGAEISEEEMLQAESAETTEEQAGESVDTTTETTEVFIEEDFTVEVEEVLDDTAETELEGNNQENNDENLLSQDENIDSTNLNDGQNNEQDLSLEQEGQAEQDEDNQGNVQESNLDNQDIIPEQEQVEEVDSQEDDFDQEEESAETDLSDQDDANSQTGEEIVSDTLENLETEEQISTEETTQEEANETEQENIQDFNEEEENTNQTEDQLQSAQEDQISSAEEEFFAPEVSVQDSNFDIRKFEIEQFKNSYEDYQEIETQNGILRRYKIKLKIETKKEIEQDQNAVTLKNGLTLSYPLDVDPTFYVVTFDSIEKETIAMGQASIYANLYNDNKDYWNLKSPSRVFKDSAGHFFVVDQQNHRVKIWNSEPTSYNDKPDIILGQFDEYATSSTSVTAGSFYQPYGIASDGTRLAITDNGRHRVLIWNTFPTENNQDADLVIGQTSLTASGSNNGGRDAGSLYYPSGVFMTNNKLLVADTNNHRVLIWNTFPTENNQDADIVLGQPDFTGGSANNGGRDAGSLYYPNGVWTDETKLMIADYYNHRVLIWNTFPTENNQDSDVVIGQTDFTSSSSSSAVNGLYRPRCVYFDGSKLFITSTSAHKVFIYNSIPSANGVSADITVGTGSASATQDRLNNPGGVFSDGTKLFVADTNNHRIMVWNSIPTTDSENADLVIGQTDFTSNITSLPMDGSELSSPGYVFKDINGRVFVADTSNNRVLIWDQQPTDFNVPADVVVGQSNMTSNSYSCSSTRLRYPQEVYSDGTKLFVLDTDNNRILIWNSIPTSNGQAADVVVGQDDFTTNSVNAGEGWSSNNKGFNEPYGFAVHDGKLLVADKENHRVLVWNSIPTSNGQVADLVIGQDDFGYNKSNRFSSLTTAPGHVFKDVNGHFYLADSSYNRVLIWFTEPLNDTTVPDLVLGQPNFIETTGNNGGYSKGLSDPYAVYNDGVRLFVADTGNNRVLIWNSMPTENHQAPDLVLGQPDMTTNSANYGGISASTFYRPTGVYSDGNKVYVYDRVNNRVLIWNSIPTSNGQAADLVLGQNDMTCTTNNNNGSCSGGSVADNNFYFYTNNNTHQPIAGDDTYFYVSDTYNHRVLVWNKANITTNMQSADFVVGQDDFTSSSYVQNNKNGLYRPNALAVSDSKLFIACDDGTLRIYNPKPTTNTKVANVIATNGFYTVFANNQKLYLPGARKVWSTIPTIDTSVHSFSYYFSKAPNAITANAFDTPYSVDVSSDGKMMVADYENSRVLIWNQIPNDNTTSADVVVGQMFFDKKTTGSDADSLNKPVDAFTDDERFYVVDRNNGRVLIWNQVPEENNASADFVVGQPDLITTGHNTGGIGENSLYNPAGAFSDGETMFIADQSNHRILVKPIDFIADYQISADMVIGQPSYYTNDIDHVEIQNLYQPTSVFKDSVGRFYVVDTKFNRIKIWNTEPADNSVEPDLVLGQLYHYRTTENDGGAGIGTMNQPFDAYSDGDRLVVSDGNNNRVLIWNEFPTNEDKNPDLVLGQTDFSGTYGNMATTITNKGLNAPRGVLIVNGKLVVADSSNNRVLIWNEFPTETGQPADVILGQPEIGVVTANNGGISASSMNGPTGLWSDGTKLFVADMGNNRVLVWNEFPTEIGEPADYVIGQADFVSNVSSNSASGLANPYDIESDGTRLFISLRPYNVIFVYNTIPTATGATADYVIGQSGFGSNSSTLDASHLYYPNEFFVDSSKVYVADNYHHRIMIWNSIPTTSGVSADKVIGPDDFTSTAENVRDGIGLRDPYDVHVDLNGKMFVVDNNNNRVLIWNSVPTDNKTPADVVLGQSNMSTNGYASGSTGLRNPQSVYSDGTKLFVADYGNNRVLIWNSIPTSNGQSADVVVGQTNFTNTGGSDSYTTDSDKLTRPTAVQVYNGKLLVADKESQRVLIWNSIPTTNGQDADVVIGQPNMTVKEYNFPETYHTSGDELSDLTKDSSGKYYFLDRGYNRVLIFNSKPSSRNQVPDVVVGQPNKYLIHANSGGSLTASTLKLPCGLAVYGTKLIVADSDNNRVLIWNTIPTTDGQSADVVLGQASFTSSSSNYGGRSASSLANPKDVAVTADGKLLVADQGNHRVLIWNTIPTANNASADVVMGQSDFTSNTTNGSDLIHLYVPRSITIEGDEILVAGNKSMIWSSLPTTNGESAYYYGGNYDKLLVKGDWLYYTYNNIYKTAWPLGASPSWELVGSAYTDNMEDLGDGDYFYTFSDYWEEWEIPCDACEDNYSTDITWGYHKEKRDDTLYNPEDLYVDGNGKLYIVDSLNYRILVYNSIPTSNGASADLVFGDSNYTLTPKAVFARDDGRVYVSDNYDRIQYWDSVSSVLDMPDKTFGQRELNGKEGTDTGPHTLTGAIYGIYGDDNGLYVADKDDNRVLIFKHSGAPSVNNLMQYENNGTTEIPTGESTYSGETNNIVIKADLNNPLNEIDQSQVKMFVEVQRLEDDFVSSGSEIYDIALMANDPENGNKVTSGTGIYQSTWSALGDYSSTAYESVINITDLDKRLYKWRAIAYNGSQYSYWQRKGSCQSFVIASATAPVFVSADQFKTDAVTNIPNTEYTNETAVRLKASGTDADSDSSLIFYFELRKNTDSFSSPAIPNMCDACPSGTGFDNCASKIWYVTLDEGDYTTTPGEGIVHILGLSNDEYKWQVNVSDGGNFAGWEAYNTTTPNFEVDYLVPVFTITDDVHATWNTTDTIAVSVVDQGPSDIDETYWTYSEDEFCNSEDVFANTGTSVDVADYQKYVCFKSFDNAGNFAYSSVIGPLKWDITGPTFTITDDINSTWNTSDTVEVSVADPNTPFGPDGSGIGATTNWGFSSNAICNASDNYGNSGTSTGAITTDHTDYVCFTNTDQLGNIGYSEAIGPLRVGTEKPTFTITDGVSHFWNTEDTIAVNVTASVGGDPGTTYWGFSSDPGCDDTDTYPNTGSSLLVNSGPHTDYICFTNTDTLARTGYSAPIGPLKWDTAKPVVTSLSVSPSSVNPGGIGNITTDVSDADSGINTCKAWLSDFPGLPALLLHSNNDNASTTFNDSSENDYTLNLHGNIKHSILQKKFGKSSIFFDGNSYLSIDNNDEWDFGTNDFTIDFWIYPQSNGASEHNGILSSIDTSNQGWSFELDDSENIRFFARDSGGTMFITLEGSTSLSLNTWHHVALIRNGDDFNLYVNGQSVDSDTKINAIDNLDNELWIGKRNNYHNFSGYLDEIRVIKGVARWTENFSGNLPSTIHADEIFLANLGTDCDGPASFPTEIGDYYLIVRPEDVAGNGHIETISVSVSLNSNPAPPTSLQVEDQGGESVPVSSLTPSFTAVFNDNGGDTTSNYRIQVDDNSDFSSPVWDSGADTATAITTCADLQNINNDLTADYYLANNIDCADTSSWNSNSGFLPIGTQSTPFTGTFDGQGYEIQNLFIDRSASNNIAVFSYIDSARISNLSLTSLDITGNNTTAGLVANMNNSIISDCSSAGSITGNDTVGGLIGITTGVSKILKSFANTTLNAHDTAGGLVGNNNAKILKSYATGSITANDNVGGLVGESSGEGRIFYSYSEATINANSNVGGLAGYNHTDSEIVDSYSKSNITATSYAGGIIGKNENGRISRSYASGSMSGSNLSGLVANSLFTEIYDSYWDTETSGQASNSSGGDGKTTTQMYQQATFTNWDFADTWTINEGLGYPYLKWQDETGGFSGTAGTRTSEITYSGPDLEDGTTYYYRVKFYDQTGAEGDWSTETASFDVGFDFDSLYKRQGNHQLTEKNALTEEDIKVELKTAYGDPAEAGDGVIDFQIIQTPQSPASEGYELQMGTSGQNPTVIDPSHITVETDAEGKASVKLKMGDRAGDYLIRSKYNDGTKDIIQEFTITQPENFELNMDATNMSMANDSYKQLSESTVNITTQTNASSYKVLVRPTTWLENQSATHTIQNWDSGSSTGFGWKIDTDPTLSSFEEPPAYTEVYHCQSTDNCQELKNITIDLGTATDFSIPAGIYTDVLDVKIEEVQY